MNVCSELVKLVFCVLVSFWVIKKGESRSNTIYMLKITESKNFRSGRQEHFISFSPLNSDMRMLKYKHNYGYLCYSGEEMGSEKSLMQLWVRGQSQDSNPRFLVSCPLLSLVACSYSGSYSELVIIQIQDFLKLLLSDLVCSTLQRHPLFHQQR